MKRVILIHGYDGSPDRDWFPWMQEQLKKENIICIAPHLPEPTNPNLEQWLKTIRNAVGTPDPQTFFIAHSLGCLTLCRYLERLPKETKIGGVIFVGGSPGGRNPRGLENFDMSKINPELINPHLPKNRVVQFYGTNDFIPQEFATELATLLGAKLIIEKDKGHYSEDFNVHKVPSVLDELKLLLRWEKTKKRTNVVSHK